MIELTRLNGQKFSVNCDLIKYVEAAPDTTLTLVTGEKLLVREARPVVVELVLQSHARLFQSAWPAGVAGLQSKLAFDAASESQKMESASLSVTT